MTGPIVTSKVYTHKLLLLLDTLLVDQEVTSIFQVQSGRTFMQMCGRHG